MNYSESELNVEQEIEDHCMSSQQQQNDDDPRRRKLPDLDRLMISASPPPPQQQRRTTYLTNEQYQIATSPIPEALSLSELAERIRELRQIWVPPPNGGDLLATQAYFAELLGPDFTENALLKKRQFIGRQYCTLRRELVNRQQYFHADPAFGATEEERRLHFATLSSDIHLIASSVFDARNRILVDIRMNIRSDPKAAAQLPKDEELYSYITPMDTIGMKDSHRLILWLLKQCADLRLVKRRDDETLYRPKMVNGCFTYSYEPYMSMERFIYKTVEEKELNTQEWCWLQGKGYGNATPIAKFLMETYDRELPFVEKNRHYHAFQNGIYYLPESKFFRYDRVADQQALELALHGGSIRTCAVKYHDHIFDYDAYETVVSANQNDWFAVRTPVFDRILDHQGFDEETKRWIIVLIGRLFYGVGEFDNWQIQLMIIGVAGSGKSTLLKFISDFFEKVDVGVIGNDSQKGFALESIIGKLIYFIYDCDQNFQLDQMLWQSMVVGEDCVVNRKYKTALVELWTTPGVLVANVVPGWSNNGDSVARRAALVRFGKILKKKVGVPGSGSDPKMPKMLAKEAPAILYKANVGYHAQIRLHGDKDFWDVTSSAFINERKKLRSNTNILSSFIESSELTVMDGVYMPWAAFREHYHLYCKKYHKKPQELKEEYYDPVFQHADIELSYESLPEDCHNPDSDPVLTHWIKCVCLKTQQPGGDVAAFNHHRGGFDVGGGFQQQQQQQQRVVCNKSYRANNHRAGGGGGGTNKRAAAVEVEGLQSGAGAGNRNPYSYPQEGDEELGGEQDFDEEWMRLC